MPKQKKKKLWQDIFQKTNKKMKLIMLLEYKLKIFCYQENYYLLTFDRDDPARFKYILTIFISSQIQIKVKH